MNKKDIQLRETGVNDFKNIMEVEQQAFGHNKEAELVAGLLNDATAKPIVSLLAFYKDEAVGHILFTKVRLDGVGPQHLLYILAPLAVKPGFQRQGIGGLLVKTGIELLLKRGADMVFVLGHMGYYPRYGFAPDAKSFGFTAPFPIPDEFANAWMVLPLTATGLAIKKGKVICANELNKPEHWRE